MSKQQRVEYTVLGYQPENVVKHADDIFALKKMGASQSKRRCVFHVFWLVTENHVSYMLRPAKKPPLQQRVV